MTQMIDTPPSEPRQRRNAGAIAAVVAGILGSVAGIGAMILVFVLCIVTGVDTGGNQATGYLLIAIAGFLVSAAGTDLRRSARVALKG
jgi:uncharacterized membrane protein YfcA